jgi:crotonyl-CoA reductase
MTTMWAYGVKKEFSKEISKIPHELRKPSDGISLLDIPKPEPKKDEVVVKVYSSALNYNSIWSAICYPISPFQLINNHIRRNPRDSDHAQDFAILGSDAAGVISEVGSDIKDFKEGDEVIIHCNVVDESDPISSIDSMLSKSQSIWGYETNYGAFAEYTKVKSSQLIKKPKDLDWETAGSYCLTLSTAYRMLASKNAAKLKSGETCLIWGASGGLGSFAVQLCNLIGASSIGIVSSEKKKSIVEGLGADFVINRKSKELKRFVKDDGSPDLLAWNTFSNYLKKQGCPEIDCVFEHVGAETLGMSVYLLKRGGRVVICGASSGYVSQIDLRYLWMELKNILGSHFANKAEAEEASSLIFERKITPLIHSHNKIESLGKMADLLAGEDISGKIVFKHY